MFKWQEFLFLCSMNIFLGEKHEIEGFLWSSPLLWEKIFTLKCIKIIQGFLVWEWFPAWVLANFYQGLETAFLVPPHREEFSQKFRLGNRSSNNLAAQVIWPFSDLGKFSFKKQTFSIFYAMLSLKYLWIGSKKYPSYILQFRSTLRSGQGSSQFPILPDSEIC